MIRWVLTINLGAGPTFFEKTPTFESRDMALSRMRAFRDKGDLTRVFTPEQIATMGVAQAHCYKTGEAYELVLKET